MSGLLAQARTLAPGTALAAVIALAATFVSTAHGGPQLLYALLFGIAFHYLSAEPRTKPGLDFCGRTVLRIGVGLLGARITAAQIAGLGWVTALAVMSAVATTIAGGVWLARRLGLSRADGVLSGGATAICGASAALAISSVLPRHPDRDRITVLVIVMVTTLSTVAMLAYPLIARALGLGAQDAGIFIGGAIHDVAQVVGAGYVLSPETGDYATIVKLFRVAMLVVVVVVVAASFRSAQTEAGSAGAPARRESLLPWFLWMFLALVLVNSLGWVPAEAANALAWTSRMCLVMAIAALGTKTSLAKIGAAGWPLLTLLVAETVWIGVWVLGAVLLLR